MEQLFPLDANKKILLAASDSGLYSYHFHNERFLRSSLLCSNYECGLSGTLYNGTLYYSYINKEHSLLLRCLGESALQFRLDCHETVTYHSPSPGVFCGYLLLIYFERTDGLYRLKIRAPFAFLPPIDVPSSLPASFAGLPDLRILPTAQHLYLLLSAGTSSFLFRYTTSLVPETLCPEEELLSRLRPVREAENAKLNAQLRQAEQQAAAQQALLLERESEISDMKSRLKQSEETLHSLAQTSDLLERAKAQYEELMQVAIQYKEEAAKWYGKFTDRH